MSATFLQEYLSEVQKQLNLTTQNLHTLEENLHEIIKMEDGHLAYFFYKTLPTPRYGWGKSAHSQTEFMIKSNQKTIEKILMPAFYVNNIEKDLRTLLNPIWELFELSKPNELDGGGCVLVYSQKN